MNLGLDPFDFTYSALRLECGRGAVGSLEDHLADLGRERALVVCGRNVGANAATMEPVEAGLGERSAGMFAETTLAKHIGEALDGVDRMRAEGVDVLVAVGSGSTFNVARAMAYIEALDLAPEEVRRRAEETGQLPSLPEAAEPVPIIGVPTTMAGADLSSGGGVNLHPNPYVPEPDDDAPRGSVRVADDRLLAASLLYDPAIFASTPTDLLAASAMNGFDKGIETIYARSTNPIADAHAIRGLAYLVDGLPELREATGEDPAMVRAAIGTALVQHGCRTNLIHTFGNGISFRYPVQQGTVHGIVAPAVLEYIFATVDARRHLLADALGIDTRGLDDDAVAEAIVGEVTAIRDALGIPGQLRTIEGIERAHLPMLADAIAASRKHARNPPGVEPDADVVRSILEAAW